MALTAAELERVERAAAAAVELHELVQQLALSEDERSGTLGRLAMAFEYAESHPGEASGGVGSFFRPMMEFDGRRYPPGRDQLEAEVIALWQAASMQIQAPLPRARLHDLCFEGGWGDRGASARAAVTAYLEAAEPLGSTTADGQEPFFAFRQVASLARALSLARMIDDADLTKGALGAIEAASERSLASEDPAAGVALGLVELLLADREGSLDAFDRLVERAKVLLSDDLFNLAEAIKLQLRRPRLDDEARVTLQRELVATILRQAESREGIARIHFLQEAAQLAADFGLADLRDEAIGDLQTIGIDDLGLIEHRFEATIPREDVERYLKGFTDQEAWEDALLLLLAHGPPSGFIAANRQQADEIARRTPLLSIVPHMEVGGDGRPRFIASTDEEKRELQLVRYEMQRARFTGVFLPEVFERIWQKWGPLSAEELTSFLGSSDLVAPELASALASDFLRYFNGDYEGACYSTTPHIEALVRGIVLAIPLPVYRLQRQQVPWQYPGLGALLRLLQDNGLDESWARYLRGFLSEPMGLNIRNELLHGLELEPTPADAALLLVCVLFLAEAVEFVMRPPEPTGDE